MIDLEELKRLYAPTIIPDENQRMARATLEEYMHDAWPHIVAKLEAAQRLREFTATLTRSHYYCEDGWYSCPQEEEGCANESRGPECDCGADEYNAALSKALAAFDKEQHET